MRRRVSVVISSLTSRAVRPHADVGRKHAHSHSHCHEHSHSHQIEESVQGEQLRMCQFATTIGGITNVFFSTTKIWFGMSGGSVALVADGFHALVDLLADIVSYATLTLSAKRLPRCRFPFGIGRTETVGAVIVASMLLFGAVTLLWTSAQECVQGLMGMLNIGQGDTSTNENYGSYNGKHDSHTGGHVHGSLGGHSHHTHYQVTQTDESGRLTILWTMVVLTVVSIVTKEVLFRWTKHVGERAGSRVIVANAYHHRADAWCGAMALVGVAGRCFGVPGVDGMAGLCVSVSLCKIGYSVLRDSILEFFDFQNASEVAAVRQVLQDYDKLHLVNVFLIRHGHSYALHVTLLTESGATAAVLACAAKDLTSLVRKSIRVADTFTTILPCDREDENSLRSAMKLVEDFHGLTPILLDWDLRRIFVPPTLDEECMRDVKSVAAFFGVNVDIAAGGVECG
uniref:Putative cation transporter n=1 Tax=Trypanosoma congolense (strain IL3000) TaxID=1068625 RepID=G0UYX5_TRYCI|nr:putative cation transporter [Trypanosoma congolense IL3000]